MYGKQELLGWLCMVSGLVATLPVAAAISQPVVTATGPVAGPVSTDGVVIAFKGIPYAAAPVGDLRWRAPQPAPAWSAVRKADLFSANCIQDIAGERKPWTREFMTQNQISEDCLYLNVWTPARTAGDKLPVYLWIHGGGNLEGSSAVAVYDGENLARRGVVVVSINYRLGVFGFLALPELTREAGRSGNYGALDQLAALQWVQKNIAAFGGDPGNITISGQSAGAGAVHSLVASPLAKGLFKRAIEESGSGYGGVFGGVTQLADAERDGVKFAASKGANSLEQLRAMAPEALKTAVPNNPDSRSGLRFGPVIDGYFLTADPSEIYLQGKQNDVPELTGMNKDEPSAGPDYGRIPLATYQMRMRERFGDLAAAFFQLYPNSTQVQSGESQKAAPRDESLVSMLMWSHRRGKTAKTPSFNYFWTHAEPGPDSERFGAFHTSEVPYVFNTLNQSDRPWTEQDRKLADLLGAYWGNFMKKGDPNGKGLPAWPAYSPTHAVTMELGDKPGPHPVAKAKVEFREKYLMHPVPAAP